MDLKNRKAYMDAICERYHKAPTESKTRILNELCEVCGYNRKYAIWKINHLKLTFVAAKPPPPHIAYQELLMAAETGIEYFS